MLASQAAGAAPRRAARVFLSRRERGYKTRTILRSENGGLKKRRLLGYQASTVTPARPLARQTSAAARASGTCRSAR